MIVMKLYEIILIAIGLAMDAFAVSICKGLAMKKMSWKKGIIISLYFSTFQIMMPLFGFFLGKSFSSYCKIFDHWIIFILLLVIGGNMFLEKDNNNQNDSVHFSIMILLALATSMDAFAVGVTFSFFSLNLPVILFIIGIITFLLSFLGVLIGNHFGNQFQEKAEKLGGIILILIGIKILIEHILE